MASLKKENKMNTGYKASMDEGSGPSLTTQGQPTRVQIKEKMANVTQGAWKKDQWAGFKGAPSAKILPGGYKYDGGK